MKNKKQTTFKVVWTVFFLMLSVVFFMPLLWMLSSSFKTSPQIFESPFRWFTDRLHWENYVEIWTSEDFPFLRLYGKSLYVSIASVAGQIIISSMAAYAFSIVDFKGRNFFFMLFLVTMMIPGQVLLIPRYVLFSGIGIYNTLWSIILPHFFSISSIFLFRQFYLSFPRELLEAAKIDGAGHFYIWSRILLPLTRNVMISLAVLGFINTWNEYLNPLIFLANKKLFTVTLGIRWYTTNTARDYNLMLAAASSAIIPVVILYGVAQDYFEQGITKSGIKG